MMTEKGKELTPIIYNSINQSNALLTNEFSDLELATFSSVMNRLMLRIKTLPAPDYIVKPHKIK
ncbi:hypothetical protein [Crocinitomix catalasitica]|uniref:hypothetical protein n=1 Tax=Crocinitomix catalasitica TaxID=184607 RepID=UPI000563D5D5|nr:hypothetical protein [Crocinitomix catalasitica]